jgi:nucleotidyltransferase substrate binding protein (TIGR01987 family)
MTKDKIILTSLQKAIESLKKALEAPFTDLNRDATIQRFEYTFELSWKLLKRYLEIETGAMEFNLKNLFREAGKQGLIDQVEDWFSFLEARNLTSHTYNEKVAGETYRVAGQFLKAATELSKNLEKRCGSRS